MTSMIRQDGVEIRALKCVGDMLYEAGVCELKARCVDRDTWACVQGTACTIAAPADRLRRSTARPRSIIKPDSSASGMKVVGGNKTSCRVVPAGKCLKGGNEATARVGDGLVVNRKGPVSDGSAEFLFNVHAFDSRCVHVGFKDPIATFSFSFGTVHRCIGVSEEHVSLGVGLV